MDATVAAALSATLAEYVNDAEPNFNVPVWQQLSAPLANLQQRSERLATLIGAVADMEAASVEAESPWCGTDPPSFTARTWIVAVRSRTADANGMLAFLRRQPYPVVARVEEGAVHLDLRSVFPRWDQQIVAAFEQRAGDIAG
jgi:seryl-tRNA(Sec) selenium transferase